MASSGGRRLQKQRLAHLREDTLVIPVFPRFDLWGIELLTLANQRGEIEETLSSVGEEIDRNRR